MRRLIAFSALSASIILGIAFNLSSVLTKSHVNWEFSDGKQFVYRVSDPDDETAPLPEGTVTDIADTMISRLETANVSKYDVETEGENQIRVTLSEASTTAYDYIKEYLSYNGEFSICTTKDTCLVGDEVFDGSTARIEYKGQYPVVVIPLSDATKFSEQIISEAKDIQGDTDTEAGNYDNTTETSTTESAMILLWSNKTESDTYEASQTDSTIASKILLKFDYTKIWYDDDHTEIASAVSPSAYGTANSSNVYPTSAVEQANAAAEHYVNLFNASPLDYNVDFLFSVDVAPSIENILTFGLHANIAWSATAIATLVALVILAVAAIAFYRLSGTAAIVVTSSSVFLSLLFYTLVGMEVTGATLIAGIAVIGLSLAGAFLYINKFKNEMYRGRSLKKANAEASKRSFWPMFDLALVSFIFGIVAYFIGGPLVQAFSVFLVFGSLSELLIVFLGMKLLMWLLTNETSFAKRLEVFGIDSKKIPNLMAEEKQTYFGRYAEKDFTKQAKKVGLGAGAVAVVGAAMMVVFGLLSGSVFSEAKPATGTRIYFQTVADRSDIDSSGYVEDHILQYITIDGEPLAYESVSLYEMSKTVEEVTTDYNFYVVEMSETIDINAENASYVNGATTYQGTLPSVLDSVVTQIDDNSDVSTVSVNVVTSITAQPTLWKVALAVTIASLAAAFYYFIRYRLSRGIAAFLISAFAGFLPLALVAITRIPVTAPIILSSLLITFFTLVLALFIFDKERELKKDDRTEGAKPLAAYSVQAVGMTAAPMAALTFIIAYFGLNFAGLGPDAYALTFFVGAVGTLIALVVVAVLLVPLANGLDRLVSRYHLAFKLPVSAKALRRRAKRDTTAKPKSAEPQEAVFIGIND